jgi:hypothetical protein
MNLFHELLWTTGGIVAAGKVARHHATIEAMIKVQDQTDSVILSQIDLVSTKWCMTA